MKQSREPIITPTRHRETVEFLISRAAELNVTPLIKYTSLTLLVHRFFPSLSSNSKNPQIFHSNPKNHQSDLQLFALISLWIASKIHGPPQIPLKTLKSLGDNRITDQHFTQSDFVKYEIDFLKSIRFDIGSVRNSVFIAVDEILARFREVYRVGDMVEIESCFDLIDLMYESDEISRLIGGRETAAAAASAAVAAAVVMTVPKERYEFPIVSWMSFVSGCCVDDVVRFVDIILHHVLDT